MQISRNYSQQYLGLALIDAPLAAVAPKNALLGHFATTQNGISMKEASHCLLKTLINIENAAFETGLLQKWSGNIA